MLRALVVVSVVLGLLVTGAPSVAAGTDSPGCATLKEYQAAKRGMVPRRVAHIFDTQGELLDGAAGGYAQGYQRCDADGGFILEYGWNRSSRQVRLYSKGKTPYPVVDCVTTDEWRYVDPYSGIGTGGTMRHVHAVFGTEGWFVRQFNDGAGGQWQIRRYQVCASPTTKRVDYHKTGHSVWWSYWG